MTAVFQHILLATEHTEFDLGAEALALALARHLRVPLACVLPLLSNAEFEAQAPALAARVEQQAAATIDALHRRAQGQGVPLTVHARRGPEPYQEIVAQARALASDLLVIRRRGQRGFLANLLLGEMVSKVVTHAPCHVLIVPRGATPWRQRVLVASEPGAQGRALVLLAAAVAAAFGLPLSVVCVPESAPRADCAAFLDEALALARQAGVAAQAVLAAGRPANAILQALQDSGADLLVIGSRVDTQIRQALIGGVAQKLIGLCPHPVLVARA